MVLNSNYENQPVVIIEALLSGIPVIALATGEYLKCWTKATESNLNSGNEAAPEKAILQWYESRSQYDAETIRSEAVKDIPFPP
ncbi:MAG: hypothetical protein R2850_11035 [Bacteroidia bacterium]